MANDPTTYLASVTVEADDGPAPDDADVRAAIEAALSRLGGGVRAVAVAVHGSAAGAHPTRAALRAVLSDEHVGERGELAVACPEAVTAPDGTLLAAFADSGDAAEFRTRRMRDGIRAGHVATTDAIVAQAVLVAVDPDGHAVALFSDPSDALAWVSEPGHDHATTRAL